MNLILISSGYSIARIKNEDKSDYRKALELVSIEEEAKDFVNIIIKAVESRQDTYLYMIQ